MLEATRKPLK